ncbi:molybdopterin-dependent oxidoreductase [Kineosporia succinea]|uniref:DMSO/TMAO reductase YedYZ molybdopterin-dependent catalytic subunit n=1 Tax=Kineosporia succinea TaxID=84632 RepID=A0ABT9P3Y0_9ACTN|nr:molybdopterin-dependent oxidoreductase [Kineosporia succinea]MDP9826775.1 DMSO/TMAO reductase YedYZ molybdopterin-dependent catalytic subunit [Kineosporia succinea]
MSPTTGKSSRVGPVRAALAGLVAAGLALGVAELVAGAIGRAVAPAIVVGGAAIDRTPRWLKEFAIEQFGENDKNVLLTGIFVTVAVLAAVVGVIAGRHRRVGLVGAALLGVVAAAAAATRPQAHIIDVVPSLVAAVVAVVALAGLLSVSAPGRSAEGPGRRAVLLTSGLAVAAGFAGVAGRRLQNLRTDVAASRRALRLPAPTTAAPALPPGAMLDVNGVSAFYTAPADFYRVDTALSVPRLTTDEWSLKIHGMVEREITLDFDDLLARPIVENDITMTCVSNEVGGGLVGTARWLGVELAPLLREVGVDPNSDQLVGTSVDGMTIGTPVSALMDGRAAMLAIAMNGEPLLPQHGFPCRMVVPGLYGYVSATKWLVDLELSRFDAFDPYWVRRGWEQQAPIKTSSRIDTPRPLARVKPGKVAVAGVAWAQQRGISKVEVRVDGGSWQEAELSARVNDDLWRQWVWTWDAAEGSHTLQVRATDREGELQTEDRAEPFPNGSSGWQSIVVTVGA